MCVCVCVQDAGLEFLKAISGSCVCLKACVRVSVSLCVSLCVSVCVCVQDAGLEFLQDISPPQEADSAKVTWPPEWHPRWTASLHPVTRMEGL